MKLSEKPITVFHSCNHWLPITENWIFTQVRYLPNSIDSHVVCERTSNLDRFWIPNLHCLPELTCYHSLLDHPLLDKSLRKFRKYRRLKFLAQLIEQKQADILHSHFGHNAWFNMKIAKRAGLKHVVTFYGHDVNSIPTRNPLWYKRYLALFKNIDCVLCEGSHMAKRIAQMGCPEHKIQVHHLGVSIEDIAFEPRVWCPTEPLRILIAASFKEKKGIPYALEAIGKLQHLIPLEVTIIGDSTSNKETQVEKERILAVIAKHQLQRKVRLLGFQPFEILLEEAYKHHVFLSPSVTASNCDTEGGAPVCLIEMAATGMPIISTTHCDIPEIVLNGVTGLLAEERNVDELVNLLQNLINSSGRWLDILKAGRAHVEREYDAKVQAEKLTEIYQSLVMPNMFVNDTNLGSFS